MEKYWRATTKRMWAPLYWHWQLISRSSWICWWLLRASVSTWFISACTVWVTVPSCERRALQPQLRRVNLTYWWDDHMSSDYRCLPTLSCPSIPTGSESLDRSVCVRVLRDMLGLFPCFLLTCLTACFLEDGNLMNLAEGSMHISLGLTVSDDPNMFICAVLHVSYVNNNSFSLNYHYDFMFIFRIFQSVSTVHKHEKNELFQ